MPVLTGTMSFRVTCLRDLQRERNIVISNIEKRFHESERKCLEQDRCYCREHVSVAELRESYSRGDFNNNKTSSTEQSTDTFWYRFDPERIRSEHRERTRFD